MVGLVGALTTYEECEGFCLADFGRGGTAALAGLFFGGLGAGVGYLVGNFVAVDRWVDVPLDGLQMDVTASPGGGLGVRVSVSF